jgi:hypothetical protein
MLTIKNTEKWWRQKQIHTSSIDMTPPRVKNYGFRVREGASARNEMSDEVQKNMGTNPNTEVQPVLLNLSTCTRRYQKRATKRRTSCIMDWIVCCALTRHRIQWPGSRTRRRGAPEGQKLHKSCIVNHDELEILRLRTTQDGSFTMKSIKSWKAWTRNWCGTGSFEAKKLVYSKRGE